MHPDIVPGHNLDDQGDHNSGPSDPPRNLYRINSDRGANLHDHLDKSRTIGCVHRIQYNLHYHRITRRVYNLRAMQGATYRNLPSMTGKPKGTFLLPWKMRTVVLREVVFV